MKYIGARYVPKFMGTYDASTEYEALSVVDNGLGTSYVSNKPTPAGTPLTNTTYWAVYGATSGAIINLQNQINDLHDALVGFVVTPIMYGAVGDGVTDDTQAIIDAIQNDHIIDLLGKTYRITSEIDLTEKHNIEIFNGKIIHDSGTTHNTFYGVRARNIYVHDIDFDAHGNDPSETYTWPTNNQCCFVAQASSNIYFERNVIKNYNYGVYTLGANEPVGQSDDSNRSFEGVIAFNYFNNVSSPIDTYGKNVEIAYNRIENSKNAIQIEPYGTTDIIDALRPFTGTYAYASAFNINIHDNFIVSTSDNAIRVFNNSAAIRIDNNFIYDFAIAINGAPTYMIVTNNTIVHQSGATDSAKTRFTDYKGAVHIRAGFICNNYIYDVLVGISMQNNYTGTYANKELPVINNNIIDTFKVCGIGVYVVNDNNEEYIVSVNGNSLVHCDADANVNDYFMRPITCDNGRMYATNNIVNTTRKPFAAFGGATGYITYKNNLVRTTQTDVINAIPNFSVMSQ